MASRSMRSLMEECGEDGTLAEYARRFSTEEACEAWLMEERWPGGWECPRCGCRSHTTCGRRRHTRQCTRCRLQFSLTKGTAMEGSKLPLAKWFLAFFLVARSKRGMSALELARDLGVCEKTAGYVLLRLRGAMSGSGCSDRDRLGGEVEMDDFLLGATREGMVGRGCGKAALIVAVERPRASSGIGAPGREARSGRCAIRAVADCSGASYREFADRHLDVLAHVRADDWKGIAGGLWLYPGLDQRRFDADDPERALPLAHKVISNFRAFVQGTFHGARPERLQALADEFSWRYSHRDSARGLATELASAACARHVPRAALLRGEFDAQPALPAVRNRGAAAEARRAEMGARVAEARRAEAERLYRFYASRPSPWERGLVDLRGLAREAGIEAKLGL